MVYLIERNSMFITFAFSIILGTSSLISGISVAGTYYVSPTGANTGTGNITAPWSLGYANQNLQPGDIAIMRGGKYTTPIAPLNSGSLDSAGNENRILYIAYSSGGIKETPLIDLGNILKGWTLVSGTEGVDAIYKISMSTGVSTKCSGQMSENTYEQSGIFASYFNKEITNRVVQSNELFTITNKAEYYCKGGSYFARTSDSKSPDTHDVRVSFGSGINLTDKSYITIDGIHVRNVSEYIRIYNGIGNIITNGDFLFSAGWACVNLKDTTKNKIINNKFRGCNSINEHHGDTFQLLRASYNLILGNDISFGSHGAVRLRASSSYNIFRENYFHDNYGKYFQVDLGSNNNVIEFNKFTGSPNAEDLVRAHKSDHPVLEIGSQNNIIRYNKFWDNSYAIRLNAYQSSTVPAKNTMIYNNTIINNHTSNSALFGGGLMIEIWPNMPNVEDTKIINNIFYNNTSANNTAFTQIGWTPGLTFSNLVSRFEGNVVFSDFSTNNIVDKYSLQQLNDKFPVQVNSNVQVNPVLENADLISPIFSLTTSSKANNSGVYLTETVNSSGGNTKIIVKDAKYFIDGYGLKDGDLIKVGNISAVVTAKIVNVNYVTNEITVDSPISWVTGAGVSMIYFDSMPDIGYENILPPATPSMSSNPFPGKSAL